MTLFNIYVIIIMKHISKEAGNTETIAPTLVLAQEQAFKNIVKAVKGLRTLVPMIPEDHPIYFNFYVALKDTYDAAAMFALFVSNGDEEKADRILAENGLEDLMRVR